MNSTEASIALNMVPGVGPVRLRRLLEVFETPEQVLLARESQLRAVDGIGAEVAAGIAHWQEKVDLSAELARIQESLTSHLHRQALSLRLNETDTAALRFLIESLNDDGYIEDTLESLQKEQFEIVIDEDIRRRALRSVQRMLEIGKED